MVVKILSSAKNFEGVDYNERKNDKGKSELLQASNFEGLAHGSEELKKSDYINYLKVVSSLNKKVVNKQFHAIISTKGRDHSPEQLRKIAVEFLDKMGYGKNPYLIYAHSDTDNNHVHLVSTRVDKKGNKINDKFEKLRSQSVIQEILNQDPRKEADNAILQALSFNISSVAQYKLLLESQGYKVKEENGLISLIKYGKIQQRQSAEHVHAKIDKYLPPDQRIKQLKAIFHKYKPALNSIEFIQFVKSKFGVEILLHQAKGKDKPYGYTIIDNSSKEVLKGSQVMPIKDLLAAVNNKERILKSKPLVESILQSTTSFSGLVDEMEKMGFGIDNKGGIMVFGDEKSKVNIDGRLFSKIKYNDRVGVASKYSISGKENANEREVIAKLFSVNPDHLQLSKCKEGTYEKYHDLFQNIVASNKADDILESLDLKLINYKGHHYLINEQEKEVVIIDQGNINNIDLNMLDGLHFDEDFSLEMEHSKIDYRSKNLLDVLFEIIGTVGYTRQEQDSQKRRKRKSK